ncbi:MAG: anti-sigma factor [Ferruginibacter sp.]
MEIEEIISSGLLELYAAGLTSEVESKEVEQWLEQYPEVAAELKEISAGVEAYAQLHAVQPSPQIKDKIFAEIKNTETGNVVSINSIENNTARVINGVAPFWRIAAAASIALLVGSVALNFVTYNKYQQAGDALVVSKQSVNSLEEQNKEMEQGLSVVQSKYSVPVSLNGLEAAPEAAAKIFWMKNTGEVFIDPSNLPDAPVGKQYQLWGIVDGKPVDGGMILTSKKGDKFRMQKMKTFGKAEAFAITLESEKGNPTPQGPMFVMGKM